MASVSGITVPESSLLPAETRVLLLARTDVGHLNLRWLSICFRCYIEGDAP